MIRTYITFSIRLSFAVGRVVLSSSILQFWDLGGQRDLRTLWSKYYSDCHAVCFVIDSTDKNSERISDCWKNFDKIISDRRIEGVPVLVLANKMDNKDAMPIESIKESFNKHVAQYNVSEAAVMPISALTGWVDNFSSTTVGLADIDNLVERA